MQENGIKLEVLGSGGEVGRAALLIRYRGRGLLLDYGVNFDEEDKPQFPLHVRPTDLDGIVLSHAHLDHTAAAPFLYTTYRVPAVMTRMTRDLIKVMLKDFLHISGYYAPYEHSDVRAMIENTIAVDYGREVVLGDFRVRLLNAGHIPGSAMTLVDVGGTRILYTGDVNTIDTRLVTAPNLGSLEADYLITEGTYGASTHPDREEIEEEFVKAVEEVIEGGGNVLIPAFSLGRSQEILALLYEKLDWAHVWFDGMTRVINGIILSYPEYLNRYDLLASAVEEFRMVRSSSERRRISKGSENVVVATAGMLKGGPAQYYLKKWMDDPTNAVFLVSYQAETSPGRELIETGRFLDLGLVRARVQWFDFSSHAGADGLLHIARSVGGLKKVIIVHSDVGVREVLAQRISEELSIETVVPDNGDTVELT